MKSKTTRRGIQSFLNLAEDPSINIKQKKLQPLKGRSKVLNENRNNLLLVRYWYYATFTNNRFDIILQLLSFEFKLSPRRIADIISEDKVIVRNLKQKRLTLKALKQIYPFFDWKTNLYYNIEQLAVKEKILFEQD